MKHKTKIGKTLVTGLALTVFLIGGGSVTAFAASTFEIADNNTATASYSYLSGQQKNADRSAQYEEIASLTTDAEREAYFEAHGIGVGSVYSASQHIDAEALVAAGIIEQETADRIAAYASQKHDKIHARYESIDSMTADQRHAFYESFESDGFSGDSIDELVNAGILTQQQADAINTYLSGANTQ